MHYPTEKRLPGQKGNNPKSDALGESTFPEGSVRLGKFIATAGVASRRHSEDLIRNGDLTVNGKIVRDPAFPVCDKDRVVYQGRVVKPAEAEELFVIMLHKPVGVISTMVPGKEKGYCLADLVDLPQRLHPIGRLDQDSSGLILMTNDGELTNHLTHPSHEIDKEYLVKLNRTLMPREIEKIRRGIIIDDRPVLVSALEPDSGGRLRIAIHEGRNRIVRRLFGALHINVLELKRIRIGSISLGKLAIGRWRKLSVKEYHSLKG